MDTPINQVIIKDINAKLSSIQSMLSDILEKVEKKSDLNTQ